MLFRYKVLGKKNGEPYSHNVKVNSLDFERKVKKAANDENIRRYIIDRLMSEGVIVAEIQPVENV